MGPSTIVVPPPVEASVALGTPPSGLEATAPDTAPDPPAAPEPAPEPVAAPLETPDPEVKPLDGEPADAPADAIAPAEPDTPLALPDGLPEDGAPAERPDSEAREPPAGAEEHALKKAAANARTRGPKKRPLMKIFAAEGTGARVSGFSGIIIGSWWRKPGLAIPQPAYPLKNSPPRGSPQARPALFRGP
jgi:hypothetical protein